MTTSARRKVAIAQAGFHPFRFRSDKVHIDLLTDSGTSAMSDRPWSGMMVGDEAYTGSDNDYRLEEPGGRCHGVGQMISTHPGRGAEHNLSQMMSKPRDGSLRRRERGVAAAGRDPQTGENRLPYLESLRLTISRRASTQAHMDVKAESVIDVWEQRRHIHGLAFTHEPEQLRFFQARFAPARAAQVLDDVHAQRPPAERIVHAFLCDRVSACRPEVP